MDPCFFRKTGLQVHLASVLGKSNVCVEGLGSRCQKYRRSILVLGREPANVVGWLARLERDRLVPTSKIGRAAWHGRIRQVLVVFHQDESHGSPGFSTDVSYFLNTRSLVRPMSEWSYQ